MRIGYARVSTADQSVAAQEDILKENGCELIYSETASGGKADRPKLKEMFDYAREGDTIVVYKLDRLGRSLKDLINLLEQLEERGIHFESITDGIDTSTSAGKLQMHLIGAMAEFERDLIRERTKAGLEAARARGRKGGRPKIDKKKIDLALRLYDSKEYSIKEIEKMSGVSAATLYRYEKKRKQENEAEKTS